MARPRKPESEQRSCSMRFSATDIERAQIEQAAHAHGLSLSEFMRRRSLGVRLPAAPSNAQQIAETTTALLRLGVNLNQIAKHMNAGRSVPLSEVADLTTRINAAMDRLDESSGVETG